VGESGIKLKFFQVFAEINYSIHQITFAAGIVAFSTSLVIFGALSISGSEISHVSSSAFHASFLVSIAV